MIEGGIAPSPTVTTEGETFVEVVIKQLSEIKKEHALGCMVSLRTGHRMIKGKGVIKHMLRK